VAAGQRIANAMAVRRLKGGDAESQITSVSSSGPRPGARKRRPQRAQRPHSKFSGRKALDGPVMRPATPLAVENGVGKPAAPQGRAKCRPGKESLANSHPPVDKNWKRGKLIQN